MRTSIAAAALAGLLIIALPGAAATAADGVLTARTAQTESAAGKLLLLDIRSRAEWRQTGIPTSARALSVHQAGGVWAFVARVRALVKGDINRRIAVICASGGRSRRARTALRFAGFTRVYDVREGMMGRSRDEPGWLRRGLPVRPWNGGR